MKILVINNSGIFQQNGCYFIEISTGEFLVELKGLNNEVVMFGQVLPMTGETTDIFNLTENGIIVKGLKRRKNKAYSYFLLYLFGLLHIIKSQFVYYFYPNAFFPLAFANIVLSKKFGLYIRGEEDITKWFSKIFYKQ